MEKFTITNRRGLKIFGYIRKSKYSIGVVFIVHGLAGYKEELGVSKMADTFLDNNYTVIAFDSTNGRGESEGEYEKTTAQKRYDDLCDVIMWAQSQEWHVKPFILVGMSLGGYVVAQYAEDNPKRIKAVFLFATTVGGAETIATMAEFKPEKLKDWKESGWFIHKSKSQPGLEFKLPWSYIEELCTHDLKPNAHKLTMPVLFMVGEKDTSCPYKYQKMLYDLIPANADKEIHTIKGAEHTFYASEHLEQLGTILDGWIKKLK